MEEGKNFFLNFPLKTQNTFYKNGSERIKRKKLLQTFYSVRYTVTLSRNIDPQPLPIIIDQV